MTRNLPHDAVARFEYDCWRDENLDAVLYVTPWWLESSIGVPDAQPNL